MKNRRRQYITDKKYQWRTVLNVLAICAAGLLVNLGLFMYLSYRALEALRWKSHIQAASLSDVITPYLIYTLILSSVLTLLALFFFLEHLLRKTAGPLYRLTTDIESAARGDLSVSIYLRKGDDFKDVAKECNSAVESFRNTFSLIKERFLIISRTLEVLEYAKDKGDVALQKSAILKENLEALRNETGKFK
jgi:methyl-accepting chemotaxis protein